MNIDIFFKRFGNFVLNVFAVRVKSKFCDAVSSHAWFYSIAIRQSFYGVSCEVY